MDLRRLPTTVNRSSTMPVSSPAASEVINRAVGVLEWIADSNHHNALDYERIAAETIRDLRPALEQCGITPPPTLNLAFSSGSA